MWLISNNSKVNVVTDMSLYDPDLVHLVPLRMRPPSSCFMYSGDGLCMWKLTQASMSLLKFHTMGSTLCVSCYISCFFYPTIFFGCSFILVYVALLHSFEYCIEVLHARTSPFDEYLDYYYFFYKQCCNVPASFSLGPWWPVRSKSTTGQYSLRWLETSLQ